MKDLLLEKINTFNQKAQEDPKLSKELEGVTRSVLIDISDGPNYSFILKDKQIGDFKEGDIDDPDMRVISDVGTITGVLQGNIGPMKAYFTKKLKIKAPIEDILRLKKLFS